jgi:hypothetical protein
MVLIYSRDPLLAEFDHLFRRVGNGEQRPCRLVDARIRRLCRQRHRNDQRERINVFQFAFRLGPLDREAAENLLDLRFAVDRLRSSVLARPVVADFAFAGVTADFGFTFFIMHL